MQILYPNLASLAQQGAPSPSGTSESPENTGGASPKATLSEPPSAVELNALRLQLVNEISKVLRQLPSSDAGTSGSSPSLADLLWQKIQQNASFEPQDKNLLDLVRSLGQALSSPPSASTTELINQLSRQILAQLAPTTPETQLLTSLSRNDFSTFNQLVQAWYNTPARSELSLSRVWLPLQSAIQELQTLGAPPEVSPQSLDLLRQRVSQQTALPLSKEELASVERLAPSARVFYASLTQITPQFLEFSPLGPRPSQESGRISLPPDSPWPQVLTQGSTLAFSLENVSGQTVLQPWPASAQIPPTEQAYWQATELPLTANTLDIRDFLSSYGPLPADPRLTTALGQAWHQLSLEMPQGQTPSPEQKDLLLRALLVSQGQPLPSPVLQALAHYSPLADPEPDLFKQLPAPLRAQLLAQWPEGHKIIEPHTLQNAIEKVLDHWRPSADTPPESRELLQQFKEHLQTTRLDQDTRHPADREQIFYWMHQGELQKGRLQIRDQRQSSPHKGKKNHQGIAFTVQTRLPQLGQVQADLLLTETRLDVRLSTEHHNAQSAMQAERDSLQEELADMGLELGNLIYGAQESPLSAPEQRVSPVTNAGRRLDLKG